MERWRIYAASGLFLALTAIKLLFPGQSLPVRQQIRELLSRDTDYRAMAEALGRRIAEENWREELTEALSLGWAAPSPSPAAGQDGGPP